jgi:hypothetical protein
MSLQLIGKAEDRHLTEEQPVAIKGVKTSKKFSIENLDEIIGKNAQSVMIYGRQDCFYRELFAATTKNCSRERMPCLQKVYNYEIGSKEEPVRPNQSLMVPYELPCNTLKRRCRSALTLILVDSYVRLKTDGCPPTPLLFAISASHMNKENNPKWKPTAEKVYSRTLIDGNRLLYRNYHTAGELRRLYCLCTDEDLPAGFRQFVKASCFFVRVSQKRIRMRVVDLELNPTKVDYTAHREKETTYELQRIKAPWEGEKGAESYAEFSEKTARRSSETPFWKQWTLQQLADAQKPVPIEEPVTETACCGIFS